MYIFTNNERMSNNNDGHDNNNCDLNSYFGSYNIVLLIATKTNILKNGLSLSPSGILL
jgi:hypothetical protein